MTPAPGPVGPSRLERARERLGYLAYSAGWRIVRLLPEAVAYRTFDGIADLAWRRRGSGVQRLEANLARARPDLDADDLHELARSGLRSYLRYWCDSFRLPDWDEQRIVSTVRTEGDEPVRAALASGQGVVMFLGHLGNWDHAGAWATLQLQPVTTVAERLKPEQLFDRFVTFRERLGMTIIPLTGGSDVFRSLLRVLRGGGFVPLLADRDLTDGGVEVDFLGEPARMAVGPAALALATGAALFAVTIRYEPTSRGRHGIVITWHPQIATDDVGTGRAAVTALTQRCADHLAAAIRSHPQDWHMLQRVFTADLDPARVTSTRPA
ncbi:phosphatidylinositol mannoside acyltransferase [Angustibacter luteus]|uniref:Phosphatidylinositol mannoside acyltransferase n=1 Tax=Angustibacter luteus TaxID=658456 RepID=A0ABW1J945_9ACTN